MERADFRDLDPQALAGTGRWAQSAELLRSGLSDLNLTVSDKAQGQMLAYLALLVKWNKAYNLTAVTEPEAMVNRHLLDSLSIWPYIPYGLAVDAGTGAGLPGLVLAIAGRGEHWVLVDGNGKKIRFIRHACRALGLTHVAPVHGRIETLALAQSPRVIVARALASLGQLVAWTERWLNEGAVLLAMKAELKESEIQEVPSSYNVSIRTLITADPTVTRQLALVGSAAAIESLDR